jgi:hypothetical protein
VVQPPHFPPKGWPATLAQPRGWRRPPPRTGLGWPAPPPCQTQKFSSRLAGVPNNETHASQKVPPHRRPPVHTNPSRWEPLVRNHQFTQTQSRCDHEPRQQKPTSLHLASPNESRPRQPASTWAKLKIKIKINWIWP